MRIVSFGYVTYSAKELVSTRLPKGSRSAGGVVVWRPYYDNKLAWREKNRWWLREVSTTHGYTDNRHVSMTQWQEITGLLSNRGDKDHKLSFFFFSDTMSFPITERVLRLRVFSESRLLQLNITSYRFFDFFMRQYCRDREIYHGTSERSIFRMILCTAWKTWEHKNTLSLIAYWINRREWLCEAWKTSHQTNLQMDGLPL